MVSSMDNSLMQSFFNRASMSLTPSYTSDYDSGIGSAGIGSAFDLGITTFTPETGGMGYGPNPSGQLNDTIGLPSRRMSRLGWYAPDSNASLPMGAMGGFNANVGWFLNRPPLAAPQLGSQLPASYQPQSSAGRAGGARSSGRSRMSVSSGDGANAADAKKIDELATKFREANGNADVSYSSEEMDEIIEEAEAAAGGDYGKFNSIMRALPARGDENWVQKFGEWHAKHIGGVEESIKRTGAAPGIN